MKTKEIEASNKTSIETAGLTPGDMAKVETAEAMLGEAIQATESKPVMVRLGKRTIDLDRLNKAMGEAYGDAPRWKAKALHYGLGRITDDVTTDDEMTTTVAIINKLLAIDAMGSRKDHKTIARANAIKGINQIKKGLILLGLA